MKVLPVVFQVLVFVAAGIGWMAGWILVPDLEDPARVALLRGKFLLIGFTFQLVAAAFYLFDRYLDRVGMGRGEGGGGP